MIVLPTITCRAEALGMSEDSRKLHVLSIIYKCLRSMCGVTRIDEVCIEEDRRSFGVSEKDD